MKEFERKQNNETKGAPAESRADLPFEQLFSSDVGKPDYRAVENAKAYMARREKNKRRRGKLVFIPIATAFVASVVALVVAFNALFSMLGKNNGQDPTIEGSSSAHNDVVEKPGNSSDDKGNSVNNTPSSSQGGTDVVYYYASNSLYYQNISQTAANEIADLSALQSAGKVIEEEYRVYSFRNDGSTAFVCAKVGYSTSGGRQDVTLIVESAQGQYRELSGYNKIENTLSIDNTIVYCQSQYVDGEYVSDAFFRMNGNKYYLSIMSPLSGAQNTLLNLIIK